VKKVQALKLKGIQSVQRMCNIQEDFFCSPAQDNISMDTQASGLNDPQNVILF